MVDETAIEIVAEDSAAVVERNVDLAVVDFEARNAATPRPGPLYPGLN